MTDAEKLQHQIHITTIASYVYTALLSRHPGILSMTIQERRELIELAIADAIDLDRLTIIKVLGK